MSSKHLLVAISSHGFGHLSQVAPAVNELKQRMPELKITLRGAFDAERIRRRIPCADIIEAMADDIGMVMKDAVTTHVQASAAALAAFHQDWDHKVESLARHLKNSQVDLVLADVPYLTLAAAERAGIAAVALSSLNWADIFEDSLNQLIEPKQLSEIRSYYQSAVYFLQCAPTMSMSWLHNKKAIGPVCSPGRSQRACLLRDAHLPADTLLILIGMGGVPLALSLEHWPTQALGRPIHYLAKADICHTNAHTLCIDDLDFAYSDLVASADLVVTKPGYGMFAEAACSGVPVIYVERNDWAETLALTDWLKTVGHCRSMTYLQRNGHGIAHLIEEVLIEGRYPPVTPSGNKEAADILASLLSAL